MMERGRCPSRRRRDRKSLSHIPRGDMLENYVRGSCREAYEKYVFHHLLYGCMRFGNKMDMMALRNEMVPTEKIDGFADRGKCGLCGLVRVLSRMVWMDGHWEEVGSDCAGRWDSVCEVVKFMTNMFGCMRDPREVWQQLDRRISRAQLVQASNERHENKTTWKSVDDEMDSNEEDEDDSGRYSTLRCEVDDIPFSDHRSKRRRRRTSSPTAASAMEREKKTGELDEGNGEEGRGGGGSESDCSLWEGCIFPNHYSDHARNRKGGMTTNRSDSGSDDSHSDDSEVVGFFSDDGWDTSSDSNNSLSSIHCPRMM